MKRNLNKQKSEEKMMVRASNIQKINEKNILEKNNSIKILGKKSKSVKKYKKKEEIKQLEVILEKKYINYDLDFIYRRERYTLKNIFSNYLVSRIKKLISKKYQ